VEVVDGEREVEIVPEIEMPGDSTVYPQYSYRHNALELLTSLTEALHAVNPSFADLESEFDWPSGTGRQ
jgi:hypothetical protein